MCVLFICLFVTEWILTKLGGRIGNFGVGLIEGVNEACWALVGVCTPQCYSTGFVRVELLLQHICLQRNTLKL